MRNILLNLALMLGTPLTGAIIGGWLWNWSMSSYIGTEDPEAAAVEAEEEAPGAPDVGGSARLSLVRAKPEAAPAPPPTPCPFDPILEWIQSKLHLFCILKSKGASRYDVRKFFCTS